MKLRISSKVLYSLIPVICTLLSVILILYLCLISKKFSLPILYSALILIGISGTLVYLFYRKTNACLKHLEDFFNKAGKDGAENSIEIDKCKHFSQLGKIINDYLNTVTEFQKNVSNDILTVSMCADDLDMVAAKIAEGSKELVSNATATQSSSNEMSSAIGQISSYSEEMSSTVETVGTSVEEMSASLNEVSKSCSEELEIANKANMQTKSTKELMERLGKSAKEIGKVLEVINNIADKTNLLALNATIEAASAGDAGKGFAVVANEVKELAKQTAQAIDEIEGNIGDMQTNTQKAMTSIVEIAEVIENVNIISQTIVSAVEEQAATISEIAKTASAGNRAVNSMIEKSNEVTEKATSLSGSVTNITEATNSTSEGITHVSGSVDMLKDLIDGLKKKVAM